jgi:hypothetical protein
MLTKKKLSRWKHDLPRKINLTGELYANGENKKGSQFAETLFQ